MSKKTWEKSPQTLIDIFYHVMSFFPEAELRKMFGYPCAFFNGNMFVGLHESNLAVRLSASERELALSQKTGDIFAPMNGRVMKEYVALSPETINNETKLKEFIHRSFHYAKTLTPKAAKEKLSSKKIS